ncbi:small ribosomal subunit protein mS31 isoform X3 [Macaca fascicularis]|uniref:small ribosomal subunit protein mS31 isoform X3 n=1 Tax=Macaca fascicularis TaxID=9541 RepID=UPI001E2531A6|nr:28S ribosomal protein S31, mitochondrial isoform X3 [Macaca fascicularis]
MFPRVSTFLPLRLLSRHPLSSGSPETSAAAIMLLAARHGTVRMKNIQRYFGTNSVICSKKDEQSVRTDETSKETSESQASAKENTKKDLLDIIKGMKVELSTVNVQTTKPPNRRPLKSLEATLGRLQRATEYTPKKSFNSDQHFAILVSSMPSPTFHLLLDDDLWLFIFRTEPLSPELVAAASAVADSLPFDKQTTKSELLRQLQQHEEESRAQRDAERSKISFSNIISDMKVARRSAARVRSRPEHQIQFDDGYDSSPDQQKTTDFRKRLRKNIFSGKRLHIFDMTAVTKEAPETDASPSLWDVEFAKQLATVDGQLLQNGFEELIQWTKEGKLWEFPINNEAGFDDDGSEFHEHIFLEKHLESFPKQGPIRHFMELVTCGLSKNPYLSVKQKVEHIEWFRNYFNEKKDILQESNIQFN